MTLVPELPASVVRFRGRRSQTVDPSTNEILAVIGTHNWGPIGGAARYDSLAEWESVFGTDDSPARTAVVGAFRGAGPEQGGGAGAVVFHRAAVVESARAGALTVRNVAAEAEDALTLTALYPGSKADDIAITTDGDPQVRTNGRLRVLYRGAPVETYTFPRSNLGTLAAAINARSSYVSAEVLRDGQALENVTASALVGGDDGDELTAAEYLEAQAALEYGVFGALAVAGLTDVAIKVQLAEWSLQVADDMRPFRLVFGGLPNETLDDVLAELTANPTLRNENIVRFGVGNWQDNFLGASLSTAEVAPRIAGIMLARGERSALTRAMVPDLEPVGNGASTTELVVGRDNGVTMLRRVSSQHTTVAISQGVTTFIDQTVADKPYELYSEPRIIGLLHRIIRYLSEWGDENVIGDLPVTDDTRNLVYKEVKKTLDELEETGLAEPGTGFVQILPSVPRDAIPYRFGFVPTRTANYLIGEGEVS